MNGGGLTPKYVLLYFSMRMKFQYTYHGGSHKRKS